MELKQSDTLIQIAKVLVGNEEVESVYGGNALIEFKNTSLIMELNQVRFVVSEISSSEEALVALSIIDSNGLEFWISSRLSIHAHELTKENFVSKFVEPFVAYILSDDRNPFMLNGGEVFMNYHDDPNELIKMPVNRLLGNIIQL